MGTHKLQTLDSRLRAGGDDAVAAADEMSALLMAENERLHGVIATYASVCAASERQIQRLIRQLNGNPMPDEEPCDDDHPDNDRS